MLLDKMEPLPDERSSLSLHDIDSDTDDEEIDYRVTCFFFSACTEFYTDLSIDKYFEI